MISLLRQNSCQSRRVVTKFIRSYHGSSKTQQNETVLSSYTIFEARGFVPTLSPAQVSSILQMNESSLMVKATGLSPLHGFETNQLASNNPIEDRRAVGRLCQTEGFLFSVMDGHGGCACAQAVQERLFDYIAVSLLPTELQELYCKQMHTDSPLELVQRHRHSNDYSNTDLSRLYAMSLNRYVSETLSTDDGSGGGFHFPSAIKKAFKRLDEDISAEAAPSAGSVNYEAVEVALSGACAIVVHIAGLHVHVANSGDCKAVLGQYENGNWHAVPLSIEHNVDCETEVERIYREHPQSEGDSILKNGRLLGQLAPLRAFGDVRYKWSVKDLKVLEKLGHYGHSVIPYNYKTPPYLTAVPELMYHRLGPRDKFLVIASDGLWEQMNNQRAVQLVGEHMQGRQTLRTYKPNAGGRHSLGEINQSLKERKSGLANRAEDTNAATHLIRSALGGEHQKVSGMLTLPPNMARLYRDDITVTVIFFDENYIAKHV